MLSYFYFFLINLVKLVFVKAQVKPLFLFQEKKKKFVKAFLPLAVFTEKEGKLTLWQIQVTTGHYLMSSPLDVTNLMLRLFAYKSVLDRL